MLKVTILLFKSSMSARKYSLFLGHFGFGLLAFSIAMNSLLAQEINFVGKIGNQVSEKNMLVKLEDIGFPDGVNYYWQITLFSIEDQHGNVVTLKPENCLYKIENTLSQEVDIHSYLSYDLYAVLSRVDKKTIHAKIYYQPWISIIWLSVFIIASGFFFLLLGRKKVKINNTK